jgi:hypothetical protein
MNTVVSYCASIAVISRGILLFACLGSVVAQQPAMPLAPLTRDELIDLCSRPIFRANPEQVLNEFVRPNKIAFLPTKREVKYLLDNGVPKIITDQLKYNFASRIMYRVCEFTVSRTEDGSFTQILNTQLETERLTLKTPGTLLYDKKFDPVVCPSSGPTEQDLLEFPHVGYVTIRGAVDSVPGDPNKRSITARLVFVSRDQQAMSVVKPLVLDVSSTTNFPTAAKTIAEWSIHSVEEEVQ